MQLPEYIPFDMTCPKCEYEPVCFVPLKVCHKLTRYWFRYLREQGIIKRASLCRQGRKRRYSVQTYFKENPPPLSPIGDVLERCEKRKEAMTA